MRIIRTLTLSLTLTLTLTVTLPLTCAAKAFMAIAARCLCPKGPTLIAPPFLMAHTHR